MITGLASPIQYLHANTSSSHPFLLQWGGSGIGIDGLFSFPQNVAVDDLGNVYVTDLGNKKVQKFNGLGVFQSSWGESGTGNGQFHSPSGITVYEDAVFVVDSQLNKIQKFKLDGTFITSWGKQGNNPGEFLIPNGIEAGINGTIYVVDTGNSRIQKFTSDGEFISQFGSSGTEKGKFVKPINIAIDNDENIFISDPGKNKIHKFNSEGEFVGDFGPNFGGYPILPEGLATDVLGNVYVADTGNNRILLISMEGTTLSSWGSMGIAKGQFKNPKDITLDNNNQLFVVDSNGHRIQKFDTPINLIPIEENIVQTTESQPATQQNTQTQSAQTLQPVNPVPGDLTKPVIIPPNDLLIEATGGLTPISVGQAMATDPSGIKSLTSNAPAQFPLGTTTVIWTAIDGAGNMGIATQVVKVVDTIAPTITVMPEITIEAKTPDENQVVLESPIATDAVGVISITNDAPPVFPIGETIVTWTATDVASNTVTAIQKINVVDTVPPKLFVPEEISIEATSFDKNEVYLGEAAVIDNGEIVSISNDAPQFFSIGNTVVTWIAADASGNTASGQQLVTIVDTTVPLVEAPLDITFEATSSTENKIDLGSPTVDDVQEVSITNDAPPVFPIGETIINWVIQDPDGNTATVSQIVNVVDTAPPILIAPENITIEATSVENNKIELGTITADDISQISSITNNAPENFPFGTTTIVWSAEDIFGNSASVEQTVNVIDTTPPQIKAPDDIVIEATGLEENIVDLGLPWVHDIIAVESFSNDAPSSFPIGMTTVTWTTSDTSGNISTDQQVITVHDTTPPELIPPTNLVIEATSSSGMTVEIGEPNVTDLIGIESVQNDSPEIFPLGDTIVTWTATDLHGNEATAEQIISIVDTTPPTIIPPTDITIEAENSNSNVVSVGTATANDLVEVISIENNAPPVFTLGENIVTWTAMDEAGNIATATQTITVIDTTSPSITAPDRIQIEATSPSNNIVELGNPTASDNIGIESIINDAPEVFPVGTTVVTWKATDHSGLQSSDTQEIIVIDTTPPKISIPKMKTFEATSETQNAIDYGGIFADDLVGVTSIENDAPEVFPLGLTTITWTVSDEAGNIAVGSQQISVVDTTAPTIVPPNDIVVEATSREDNAVKLGEPQGSDLVSVSMITNDAPPKFKHGETIVTWTITDTSGNSANATQKITLIDSTPPTIKTPEDLVIEATSPNQNQISLIPPISSDSVSEITITNNAPKFFPLGETIITWTSTDNYGNSATMDQKITVVDTTAPELFVPDNITIDAISLQTPVDVGQAVAVDSAGSEISISNDAPFSFPLGETIVTWTVTDSFGNSDTSLQTINVQACGKPDSYYNIIMGTPEDDIISGTNVADLIFAKEGDDIIMSGKGNDCIFGEDGDDIIFGNEGADNISGGDGSDVLKGQSGDDIIIGGFGVDVIDGGDDTDSCNTNQDPDGDLKVKCEF